MSHETVSECPVKNCNWSVTVERFPTNVPAVDFFLQIRHHDENLEQTLQEHLLSHPRWRLNRKIRKALRVSLYLHQSRLIKT